MSSQPPQAPLPREYVHHLARQGFDLLETLGRGLSGSVYAAVQRTLHRKVAVKFFDSAYVRDDAAMHKRFVREAKLLARFQHPNIPYVLTEGVVAADHGQAPYMVMEYVHGRTLQEILHDKGKLDLAAAVDITVQVLDALGYAHSNQIVHRDVKPSNIMIDARDRCFLIDFSIGVSFSSTQEGVTRATTKGAMLGSPPYASPEQLLDAASVDARSDLYGVGVMLVEMLTGNRELTNLARSMSAFPRELVAAIEKACATDRSGRHVGADDFIRAIGRRHLSLPPSLAPALALCTNTRCPDADWTDRGFYRGPRVIRDSISSYCTSCGKSLTYLCRNCSSPVSETPYCGGCGAEVFTVPECKSCGSWLTRDYMDSMGASGCLKCKDKQQRPVLPKPASGFDDMDDDIPF